MSLLFINTNLSICLIFRLKKNILDHCILLNLSSAKFFTMVFLEFEKPLEKLYEQLEKIREVEQGGEVDVSATIKELENYITSGVS